VSQVVLEEAAAGDRNEARKRLVAIRGLPSLAINDEAIDLAEAILTSRALPDKAARDATHIAVSAVQRIQYLLTWNCRHLANAEIYPDVRHVCLLAGYDCPIICTPDELLGRES
jgi:hypothetical protein